MKRFQGLLRDTWWLWIILAAVGLALAYWVSPIFLVTFPICFFAFVYFGLMRYDENGQPKEGF